MILSGATFLGLDFGGGLDADFDFLRAFGPDKTNKFRFNQENSTSFKLITVNIFFITELPRLFHIYWTLPLPSLVLALRSGGAGAAKGKAGV